MDAKSYWDFEQIGQISAYESYDWRTLLVIRDRDTSQLFYIDCGGCSCSTPSDYFGSKIEITDLRQFTNVARKWARPNIYPSGCGERLQDQATALIRKVRETLDNRPSET